MENKSSCFISYCHQDTDRDEINFLVEKLKSNSRKTTDIFYDQDIGIGKRFKNFMQLLDVVDLVIMICTPKFKEKAEKPDSQSGVGYEYSLIKTRYFQILKEKKETPNEFLIDRTTNPFEVMPVVLKGNFDSSIPLDFIDNNAIDMTYYKLISKNSKRGEKIRIIPKNTVTHFENDLSKIIDTLKANHGLKQESYKKRIQTTYDKLKMDRLFRDTKADFSNPKYSMENYESTLFVRTHVYRQIENQSAYILVGRKGSGKSAITQVLPLRSIRHGNQYFAVVDIYANRDINLNVLYSFVNREFVSDTKNVFQRLKCFKFGWALFFRICLMDLIVKHEVTNSKNKVRLITHFIEDINKMQSSVTTQNKSGFFTYSFTSIQRYMNFCISRARHLEEFFNSDIESQFNFSGFIDFTIGKSTNIELEKYLEHFPQKFLITFDGFDTEIERFREQESFYENDSLFQKVSFEIDWLHSLLLLVNDIKQLKTGNEILDDKLDFCLTIPNHRYLEILNADVDSYRFQNRRKNLVWSGIELLIFLRKRLAVLANYEIKNKSTTPWDAYEEVMKECFPSIPQIVEFEFNGRPINLNLFFYVLRHTFWRPRDILLYFAHIITLCEDCKQNGHEISHEAIRTTIANLTFEIIKDDFKNEYKGVLRNLDDILNVFIKSNQILAFQDVEDKLYKVDFEFVVVQNDEIKSDVVFKIKFLYKIGFFGILVNQDIKDKYNLFSDHIFIFNEGCKLLKKVNKETLKEYNFIIHPIFCEYLELTTKNNEFISEYSKNYIMNIEGFMQASNSDFACD